jgi:hypothetical protein
MAMGLLSGIRALAWAIVLLMVAMQHWCCRAKPEHSWQLPNRARQNNMVRSCQTNVFQCFSYIYGIFRDRVWNGQTMDEECLNTLVWHVVSPMSQRSWSTWLASLQSPSSGTTTKSLVRLVCEPQW